MTKAAIFKKYDKWIAKQLRHCPHCGEMCKGQGIIFKVSDEDWEAHFQALDTSSKCGIQMSGYWPVEYEGKTYACMSYKGVPFIKDSDVKEGRTYKVKTK